VGSPRRRADRELIEKLRRFARGDAYDEQAMSGLNSEGLDFRALPSRSRRYAGLELDRGPIGVSNWRYRSVSGLC
jgi:hypothetical protein